ncbi:MAG TPA: 2-amino-4-hydroxy-6-hydroxymethyldihydropteridine diphosphokinase [Longimicrobiales bacterium]
MPRVYLGLGTNLGDREAHLREALRRLRAVVAIDAVSSVYQSEPVGYRAQPDFWNLVVRGRTELAPEALLEATRAIERAMGRRPSFRNAPRVIDIDLLFYDDVRMATPSLVLPHPRLIDRAFVLRPLVELDPELRHPGTGERLAEVLSRARGLERTEVLFPGSRLLEGGEGSGGVEDARME